MREELPSVFQVPFWKTRADQESRIVQPVIECLLNRREAKKNRYSPVLLGVVMRGHFSAIYSFGIFRRRVKMGAVYEKFIRDAGFAGGLGWMRGTRPGG
jgi:hypothetical protein